MHFGTIRELPDKNNARVICRCTKAVVLRNFRNRCVKLLKNMVHWWNVTYKTLHLSRNVQQIALCTHEALCILTDQNHGHQWETGWLNLARLFAIWHTVLDVPRMFHVISENSMHFLLYIALWQQQVRRTNLSTMSISSSSVGVSWIAIPTAGSGGGLKGVVWQAVEMCAVSELLPRLWLVRVESKFLIKQSLRSHISPQNSWKRHYAASYCLVRGIHDWRREWAIRWRLNHMHTTFHDEVLPHWMCANFKLDFLKWQYIAQAPFSCGRSQI